MTERGKKNGGRRAADAGIRPRAGRTFQSFDLESPSILRKFAFRDLEDLAGASFHPDHAQTEVRCGFVGGESVRPVLVNGEIAARASGAGEARGPLSAGVTLRTLSALHTLGALRADITLLALNALDPRSPLEALGAGVTFDALDALGAPTNAETKAWEAELKPASPAESDEV